MKTRIVVERPDYAGDVKVAAQKKESWWKNWERIDYCWAFRSNRDLPRDIAYGIERMKQSIDFARGQSSIIKYPEAQ